MKVRNTLSFINLANAFDLERKIINCYICTNIQKIIIIPRISVLEKILTVTASFIQNNEAELQNTCFLKT